MFAKLKNILNLFLFEPFLLNLLCSYPSWYLHLFVKPFLFSLIKWILEQISALKSLQVCIIGAQI